ncbi:N-ethylammeline chlorohydrolase [Microbulbifer flavimaris]|uniref:5-methylthioadenosine/S-adenosylhomocysteine deaminase n=1 Tax=Microbulbifer flavimaris TaxID=1781068 RepID=A0ABX4I4U6_9GAMM|nr:MULTISPECIES: TRZ/ATZ family hydrolase [Microbulbifer]KUJ84457.1 N-ethylammeline chlorohydrolase [Microbulbifer sp. ZGT114]PCO06544.1 N-ethylammeline chlorohydrolase [Microbulbifer flavimaris]
MPAPEQPPYVDTLIHARWIIPVVPADKVYENCALAIRDGRIQAILPSAEAARRYRAGETVQLDHHVLIPGLINTHTHAAMTLLRGYADDRPLMEWLQQHIWPAEQKWVNPAFVADGSRLAVAEMLRSGTTTFSDQYFFPEATALVARETGMRAQIAFPVIDAPTPWSRNGEDALQKGLALRDDYRAHERIDVVFAPHAPYTVGDETLEKIAVYAAEAQIPVQMHLHETAAEVERAVDEHGERPTERLYRLGLLSPQTLCVHMTAVEDRDVALLRESGAHVAHCPRSNLKLASGFCPASDLLDAGINVALGTDGAASNNGLDLFAEANTAALLAKAVSGRADALPARQALAMATIHGARALGIEDRTGSLEPGKYADLAAVDLGGLEQQPLHDPISQLVYTGSGHLVTDVWVAGRQLLDQRQLTTLNEAELVQRAQDWRARIAGLST